MPIAKRNPQKIRFPGFLPNIKAVTFIKTLRSLIFCKNGEKRKFMRGIMNVDVILIIF